jgi:hypothetical protein
LLLVAVCVSGTFLLSAFVLGLDVHVEFGFAVEGFAAGFAAVFAAFAAWSPPVTGSPNRNNHFGVNFVGYGSHGLFLHGFSFLRVAFRRSLGLSHKRTLNLPDPQFFFKRL